MKAQARDERAAKQSERAYLQRERQAREEADRKRTELEMRVRKFEDDARNAMEALSRSEMMARELEVKVQQAQMEVAAREALWAAADKARREAEATAKKYQSAQAGTAEERSSLLAATKEAERRAAEMELAAEKQEQEAIKLNEALLQAKRKQVADARALMEATAAAPALGGAARDEPEHETDVDADVEDAAYDSMTGNEDLLAGVRRHVERERQTVQEKNRLIRQQLEALASALDSERDKSKETELDRLHRGNQAQGRDKFKTLRLIRAGNVKQRVTDFENM